MDAVKETLKKDGEVSIEGFGTFYVGARQYKKPIARTLMHISILPSFAPDAALVEETQPKVPYFKAAIALILSVERALGYGPPDPYACHHSDEWNGW